MAEAAGKPGWAIDDQDLDEMERQARDFASLHQDVIDPLVDRIEQLKAEGCTDSMLMFSALLLSIGNRLLQYVRTLEAAAHAEKN